MTRKNISTQWDRDNRNAINDNFKKLFDEFGNVVEVVSEKAYGDVIEAAKLNWKEPVNSYSDLPSEASEGDTRFDRETGRVYRFNGSEWIEIQQIDASAINEVDNRLTSQLAHVSEDVISNNRALNYYWKPEMQRPARIDQDNYWADGFGINYDEIINDYMEPLRNSSPFYITRVNMGKDQSGEYDVWRYHFTPENYTKTIIITSALHGSEVTTTLAMIRFFYYLINDWEKYPVLADVRENTRIIYFPSANPWGTSQNPRTRYNSRGVDLNRNFPYLWEVYESGEPFSHDYKGEEPFSEVESQYIRDTLLEFSDAVVFIDLHNTGSGQTRDYFVPIPQNYSYKTYDKLLAYFTKDIENPEIRYTESNLPTAPNYAYNTLGIPASGPEWVDGSSGESQYSALEITNALAWFANVIIEHNREFAPGPVVMERYYNHASSPGISINSDGYEEIEQFKELFDVPADGLVTFEGFITVGLQSGSGSVGIVPKLGQTGNGTGNSYDSPLMNSRWGTYAIANNNDERIQIPFFASIPVKKTTGADVVKMGFGLAGQATEGNYRIYRYRGRMTYTPSYTNNHDEKQIYA